MTLTVPRVSFKDSGEKLVVEAGGQINIEQGGSLKFNGRDVTNTVAVLAPPGDNPVSTTALTLGLGDNEWMTISSGSAIAVTIPLYATVPIPVGTLRTIKQGGAGQITVAGALGVTVGKAASATLVSKEAGALMHLYHEAINQWHVSGELVPV